MLCSINLESYLIVELLHIFEVLPLFFSNLLITIAVSAVLLNLVVNGGKLLKGDKKYCVFNYQLVYKSTFQAHTSSVYLYRVWFKNSLSLNNFNMFYEEYLLIVKWFCLFSALYGFLYSYLRYVKNNNNVGFGKFFLWILKLKLLGLDITLPL